MSFHLLEHSKEAFMARAGPEPGLSKTLAAETEPTPALGELHNLEQGPLSPTSDREQLGLSLERTSAKTHSKALRSVHHEEGFKCNFP